jgi:Protein of unknown function (DUF2934)
MNLSHHRRFLLFLAPEYGGDAVSGGGHPADSSVPESEAIADALGENAGQHGKTRGVGVPGSKTNPVPPSQQEVAELAQRLWEEEGRPEGKAEEHWLRAETELRQRTS